MLSFVGLLFRKKHMLSSLRARIYNRYYVIFRLLHVPIIVTCHTSIVSFADVTPVVLVEFDASLSGAGLIWYHRSSGAEVAMGVGAVDLSEPTLRTRICRSLSEQY
jgi:hypothetical protein